MNNNMKVVCLAVVSFIATSAAEAQGEVVFRDCPKCSMQIRIADDAKTAFVNLSRLDGADRETRAARARRLLALAKPLAPTGVKRPLMGWSSWNTFGCEISEEVILDTARAMATNGLKAAGYTYVNIDDGFFGGHGEDGVLRFNPRRFPNGMKPTVDGIHALGLKAGIYSDAGADTCGSMWRDAKGNYDLGGKGGGLYGHDAADCKLHFVDLGFDFIKVDYCGGQRLKLDERARYTEISKAIRATGRDDVRLNICRWAFPGAWAADIAESWRTTGDIRANWKSLKGIVKENLYLSPYAKPGAYNDMDMLEVGHLKGQVKTAFGKSDEGFTPDEEELHFGLWCMLSSPLLIGCDVRTIPAQTLSLVTNPYLLAMSQNDLGLQAYVAQRVGSDGYVLVRDVEKPFGTKRAVAFVNLGDEPREMVVPFYAVNFGLNTKDSVPKHTRNVRCITPLGGPDGGFSVLENDELVGMVPAHGTRIFIVESDRRHEQDVYEAETAFLPMYQELHDAKKAKIAYYEKDDKASGGMVVAGAGGRKGNTVVWERVWSEKGGKYAMTVKTIGEGGAVKARVNGTIVSGTAKEGAGLEFSVTLRPGLNEVCLFNDFETLPAIDVMTLEDK